MVLNWLWPQKSVSGQVVLVTGGAMGLGRMIALRFAALGAIVLVWDVDVTNGLQVVQQISSMSGESEAHFFEVDVGDREAVYRAGRQVLEQFGAVDILVNNAGVVCGRTLLNTPDAAIERTFAINTLAHFWTVRAFLPDMLQRNRGHIVCIGSAGSLFGFPNMVDYGATKFASYGFMCHLRQELRSLGKRGIHLTVVCPSFIKTGMFEGVRVPMLTTWLSPGYAADEVVKAVRRNQWRLLMPSIVWLLALVVALTPIGFYDLAMRITGALNAMKRFRQTRVHPGFGTSEGRDHLSVKEGRPFADMHQDSMALHRKHTSAVVVVPVNEKEATPFSDLHVEAGHATPAEA
jgi:all-trans-retinol dehydrogenase (NAD+)